MAVSSQDRGAKRTPKKRKSRIDWRAIFYGLLRWGLVAGIWAGVAVAAVVAYFALTLPDISGLEDSGRKPSIRLALTDGTVFASSGEVHGRPAETVPGYSEPTSGTNPSA